ncbi:zinc ribbon domain-containing protein [uncultured Methanoregula sp.]|uniref:zinc ribbon domain-containing protein n=1 Tax=uncultured Methanoregula sp. TaxID=1005933 RepID=UPI002AAB6E8C|nr:zinc ribbon domain-containing protein [uncultured Methanoregula sp.]
MGDPVFRNNEKILLRTEGVNVKSIPFEGVLTDQRIILVDQARNVLPPKDILLSTIRQILPGENAIRDPTLTIYVTGDRNETRQMVLTFSRDAGGNRLKERDEWVQLLGYYIARAPPSGSQKIPESPVSPRNGSLITPKKRIVENAPPGAVPRDTQSGIPAPIPNTRDDTTVPGNFFCNRCGNRVSVDSAFCNRCGAPIVPPAPSPYAAPAPASTYVAPPQSPPAAMAPERPDTSPALDAVRIAPQDLPVRPPVRASSGTADQGSIPIPRKSPPPATSKKPQKQGFIPRLFSSKARSATPKSDSPAPSSPPPAKQRRGGGGLPKKKIILTIVAVVIILAVIAAGVLVVYPMISAGGFLSSSSSGTAGTNSSSASPAPVTTTPQGQTTSSSQTTWTPVSVETTQAAIPPTGVQLHISYLGGYKGTYGLPAGLQSVRGSGDKVYLIENATGAIKADIEKTDGSTRHDLVVEIYKDGKLLTKGSTNAGFGKVSLAVDVTTGIAKTPVTSASAATATTTAAATAQKTTSATNATVVTTTKAT